MGFICFLLVLNNLYLPLLMVKGNWERRIELANERRAKAKERKENKGKVITPENVMRRILLIAESEKATHRNYLSPSSDQGQINISKSKGKSLSLEAWIVVTNDTDADITSKIRSEFNFLGNNNGGSRGSKKREKGGGNRHKSGDERDVLHSHHPGGNVVCSKHFRSESCNSKRCKYSHQVERSLLHIKNVYEKEDLENIKREDLLTDPYCKYIDLHANTPSDPNVIRFIAFNGECVYDYFFPELWKTWYENYIKDNE